MLRVEHAMQTASEAADGRQQQASQEKDSMLQGELFLHDSIGLLVDPQNLQRPAVTTPPSKEALLLFAAVIKDRKSCWAKGGMCGQISRLRLHWQPFNLCQKSVIECDVVHVIEQCLSLQGPQWILLKAP